MRPLSVLPVKLVMIYLYRERRKYRQALDLLQDEWGMIDHQSQEFFFDQTDYYVKEMGQPLFRSITSFINLVDPSELASIKLRTNQIEIILTKEGSRTVNLDPGYLDYDKLVLASAKYNYQKIYLGKGIYADPILFYRKGRFEDLEWTFPDFKEGMYESDLLHIRYLYKQQSKGR